MIKMLDLKNFTDEEERFLTERLEVLLKENVITGVNTYCEIVELDVCLPLSYLQH